MKKNKRKYSEEDCSFPIVVRISSQGTGNVLGSCIVELVGVSIDEGLHTICIQLPIVGCCLVGIGELEVKLSLPSY